MEEHLKKAIEDHENSEEDWSYWKDYEKREKAFLAGYNYAIRHFKNLSERSEPPHPLLSDVNAIRIYKLDEIHKVYKQHAYKCGTVVYSDDGGYTWQSVPMDSGKWNTSKIDGWIFAFISSH